MTHRYLRKLAILAWAACAAACGEPSGPLAPDSLRVKTVQVTPLFGAVFEGDTLRFQATVRDSADRVVDVPVRWESANPAVLSIDSTGLATAHDVERDDSARVIARAGVGQGSVMATVRWQVPFVVWPDTNVLFTGMTRKLVARLDSSLIGFPGPNVDTVTATSWTTGDAAIATVDAAGTVTARAAGYTWIRAQWGSRTATAWLQVTPPPPTPLRFISVSSGGVGLGFSRTEAYVEKGCGLIAWGDVYCWGYGMSLNGGWSDRCEGIGRTGQSYVVRRYTCTEIPVRLFTSESFYVMANNSSLGCGINGARRVFCWGSNRYGELGIGSIDTLPHGVTPIASTDEFRSVHMTEMTSPTPLGPAVTACAIRMDDAVFCWGSGFTPTPARVQGVAFSSLALSGRCGVATDGSMRCLPNEGSRPVVPGEGLVEVATQPWSGPDCARRNDGVVLCGTGTQMQLGEPATMVGTYWTGAGEHPSVCAITASGQLRCGLTTTTEMFPGRRWKTFFGNCGIATDDKTYCWRQGVIREVPGQ